MTTDMMMLVWSVVLTLVQVVLTTLVVMPVVGMPAMLGNRENFPQATGMAGRAQRAHRNMLENLVLFASLVLVAQAAGKANATTALGAQIFFWARLAYVPIYIAGIPYARTVAWTVSVIGLIMILLQLI